MHGVVQGDMCGSQETSSGSNRSEADDEARDENPEKEDVSDEGDDLSHAHSPALHQRDTATIVSKGRKNTKILDKRRMGSSNSSIRDFVDHGRKSLPSKTLKCFTVERKQPQKAGTRLLHLNKASGIGSKKPSAPRPNTDVRARENDEIQRGMASSAGISSKPRKRNTTKTKKTKKNLHATAPNPTC
ncbi:hypothetical protein FGB62_241g013 [Gracilaria domingensis]|nr:hypothetical protein FGB62_241g013 [Gracilaria domingensis]